MGTPRMDKHRAVGPGALGMMGKARTGGHCVGSTRRLRRSLPALLSPYSPQRRLKRTKFLEGRADPHQIFQKVEQAQHGLVPGDQLGGGVEYGDGLVQQIGQQQIVAAQFFGRAARCRGEAIIDAGDGLGDEAKLLRGAVWRTGKPWP